MVSIDKNSGNFAEAIPTNSDDEDYKESEQFIDSDDEFIESLLPLDPK